MEINLRFPLATAAFSINEKTKNRGVISFKILKLRRIYLKIFDWTTNWLYAVYDLGQPHEIFRVLLLVVGQPQITSELKPTKRWSFIKDACVKFCYRTDLNTTSVLATTFRCNNFWPPSIAVYSTNPSWKLSKKNKLKFGKHNLEYH